jgi:hypothetical protein
MLVEQVGDEVLAFKDTQRETLAILKAVNSLSYQNKLVTTEQVARNENFEPLPDDCD